MLTAHDCQTFKDFTDQYQKSLYAPVGRRVLRQLDATAPIVAIDMGTGPGYLTKFLAENLDGRVHSVDINPAMHVIAREVLNEARPRARVSFDLADVHALPYANDYADLLVSYTCYHHYADPRRALRECVRVLKPGGVLIIIDCQPVSENFLVEIETQIGAEYSKIVRKAFREAVTQSDLRAHLGAAVGTGFTVEDFVISLEDWMECLDAIEEQRFESLQQPESTMWIAIIRKEKS